MAKLQHVIFILKILLEFKLLRKQCLSGFGLFVSIIHFTYPWVYCYGSGWPYLLSGNNLVEPTLALVKLAEHRRHCLCCSDVLRNISTNLCCLASSTGFSRQEEEMWICLVFFTTFTACLTRKLFFVPSSFIFYKTWNICIFSPMWSMFSSECEVPETANCLVSTTTGQPSASPLTRRVAHLKLGYFSECAIFTWFDSSHPTFPQSCFLYSRSEN